MSTNSGKYVGIDVSKEQLDVAVIGQKRVVHFENECKGIAILVADMQQLQQVVIVVEATGVYEEELVLALYETFLPVALVSPQRVRQYARA